MFGTDLFVGELVTAVPESELPSNIIIWNKTEDILL